MQVDTYAHTHVYITYNICKNKIKYIYIHTHTHTLFLPEGTLVQFLIHKGKTGDKNMV